jgi:uncharacterized membrane protein
MTDSEKDAESEDRESNASRKFFILFIAGFFILFIAGFFIIAAGIIILVIAALLYGGSTSSGVVIILWFIPIAIGTGPESTIMIFIAVIFAILSVILFLIMHRRPEETDA